MKLTKSDRKHRLQSIADKIIDNIIIENPEIECDTIYTNKKLVSRYVCFILPSKKQFIVRISDHMNSRKETYQYNIIVDYNVRFKMCSTVIDILTNIEEYENENSI